MVTRPLLTCTICGVRPSFLKLRLELTHGAATYLVCTNQACIDVASERARLNMHSARHQALSRLGALTEPLPPNDDDVIDAKVVE